MEVEIRKADQVLNIWDQLLQRSWFSFWAGCYKGVGQNSVVICGLAIILYIQPLTSHFPIQNQKGRSNISICRLYDCMCTKPQRLHNNNNKTISNNKFMKVAEYKNQCHYYTQTANYLKKFKKTIQMIETKKKNT